MMEEPRDGAERYKMRQRLVSFGDDFWIENDRGERVFKVNGKILRIRKTLEFEDKKYRIGDGKHRVAKVSKKWFRITDTYGVQVAANQDDILVLAITVAIDAMVHPKK